MTLVGFCIETWDLPRSLLQRRGKEERAVLLHYSTEQVWLSQLPRYSCAFVVFSSRFDYRPRGSTKFKLVIARVHLIRILNYKN